MRFIFALAFAFGLPSSPVSAEWQRGAALPTAVPHAVAAEMEGNLFVLSGKVGQGLRSFFEQYDLRNDGWRPLTPMPVAISQFSLACGQRSRFGVGRAR